MISAKMLLETTRDLKVLYVEDDEELCLVTKDLLELYFAQVDIAMNGKLGLEKFTSYKRENGEYYDIVMTDINMPVMDGLEMSKEIYTINETQAIVILTAHNSAEYLLESISLGIDGFMMKPIDNDQLFKTIFKISQALNDHKMIELYVQQVEDLNEELATKNETLLKKNQELEKSLRMLDTVIGKDEVIKSKAEEQTLSCELDRDIQEQIFHLIHDDLFELKEILVEIDVTIIEIINNQESISSDNITLLVKHFTRYAAILNYYTFFNNLSLSMSGFAEIMKDIPLPTDEETVHNIFTFLETFIYVLSKWHDDLSSGDESKINQFDASIISDMETIQNMWTQSYGDSDGEENLDDIFDF